ncbi:MAG: PAS domain S-box protein [Planctomycetaceae bacterium]
MPPIREILTSNSPLLEMLFQNAPIGLLIVDRQFRFVRVNQMLSDFNGHPVDDLLGKTVAEVVPSLWPTLEPLYRRALAGESITNTDFHGIAHTVKGDARHWQASYYPIRHNGEVIGVGAIVSDVTSRKLAEEALTVRNDLYAMLSRTNRAVSQCQTEADLFDAVCKIAVETGRFKFAWIGVPQDNQVKLVASAGEDCGYMQSLVITLDEEDPRSHGPTGRAAILGKPFVVNDFMTSPMTAFWKDNARRVGFAASAALPLWRQGKVAAVFTLYAPVKDFFTEDLLSTLGEITPSVSFGLDRLRAEEIRKEDEAKLHLRDRAINAIQQGILITDCQRAEFPIIYVSPGFQRLTGYTADEAIQQNCSFLQGKETDQATVAHILESIQQGKACDVELINYRKDGSPFWNHLALAPVCDEQGKATHFIAVMTDVTERRTLEAQFRQSQKMEAVGQLAGGIAHDFNNLLTVITGYSEILKEALQANDPLRELAEEVYQAGERSAALTRQLLAFSRKQVLVMKPIDLRTVVHGVEKMLQRIIGENIELITQCDEAAHRIVKADSGQLEQVLVNLAVNARDAMPQGGTLTIGIDELDLSAKKSAARYGLTPGKYVRLSVRDTGTGIPDEIMPHLFEPFFTTKEKDRGTGLGLPVVHGIVKQFGGEIDVQSKVGQGATFHILLPRQAAAATETDAVPASPSSDAIQATVLLVEDESGVREFAKFALESRGYTVLEASCGSDALARSASYGSPIHLLIADVVLPGINGRELWEQLQSERPGLKVLYLSGYMDETILRSGLNQDRVAFLQKPFSPSVLAQKVREVLEA